ncbi:hypothetical protein VCHA53O466_40034 [Vibrio chagasii]|nr:hypothetical protein VCHA53O466_40034 [Vibrio chagasii]
MNGIFQLKDVVRMLLSSHGIHPSENFEIRLPLVLSGHYSNAIESCEKVDGLLEATRHIDLVDGEYQAGYLTIKYEQKGTLVFTSNGDRASKVMVTSSLRINPQSEVTGEVLEFNESLPKACRETHNYLTNVLYNFMARVDRFDKGLCEEEQSGVDFFIDYDESEVASVKKL